MPNDSHLLIAQGAHQSVVKYGFLAHIGTAEQHTAFVYIFRRNVNNILPSLLSLLLELFKTHGA
jgi:hypothetical protein